jgi:hypothetical protein
VNHDGWVAAGRLGFLGNPESFFFNINNAQSRQLKNQIGFRGRIGQKAHEFEVRRKERRDANGITGMVAEVVVGSSNRHSLCRCCCATSDASTWRGPSISTTILVDHLGLV